MTEQILITIIKNDKVETYLWAENLNSSFKNCVHTKLELLTYLGNVIKLNHELFCGVNFIDITEILLDEKEIIQTLTVKVIC